MPIEDRVLRYSVRLGQSNIQNLCRTIQLSLASGGSAYIAFPAVRPANFLQFVGSTTTLFMTADQFTDVHHILQTESPVFFTALNLFGGQIGAVHTELDLALGEPPGEGETDAQTLEAIVRQARLQPGASTTSTVFE